MNEYGSSTSRNRQIIKSPNPHTLDDPKVLKRKYQQAKQSLRFEKKNSEMLEQTIRGLKQQNSQIKQINNKQSKQLCKKQQQIDILLEQIKYLKNVIADNKSKKSSKEISSYEEQPSTKSTHSQEGPTKVQVVGGYFGSIFN